MNIILYNNSSEKNKINKTISQVTSLGGSLKEPSNVVNPVITIEYNNPVGFNYAYIDAFGRYYFVDEITMITDTIMQIKLSVDVLESFKSQILAQNVVIDKSTNDFNMYLPNEDLITLVKTKTDIINFPSGLLESGEFVLITAGG